MQRAPFAVFRKILLDLGFTLRVEPGQSARFDHLDSTLWVALPAFKDDELVPTPHLIGTQRLLDERGLMPREQFEELLRQGAVAG